MGANGGHYIRSDNGVKRFLPDISQITFEKQTTNPKSKDTKLREKIYKQIKEKVGDKKDDDSINNAAIEVVNELTPEEIQSLVYLSSELDKLAEVLANINRNRIKYGNRGVGF